MNSLHSRHACRFPVWMFAIVAMGLLSCQDRPSADYLSPDLRDRVERLKADAATRPTSQETVQARTDVLWDWLNAYSLTGGPVPVDVTLLVSSIRIVKTDGGRTPVPWLKELDRYIREFTIKDEEPEALGQLHFVSPRVLTTSTWDTVQQVYTVGSRPIVEGGGLMLARQRALGPIPFQFEDPTADWYITAVSSDPSVTFKKEIHRLGGMHGGYKEEVPVFLVEGSALQPGDSVTITYGDTSGGGKGFMVQDTQTDTCLFPVYVDLEGQGNFLTLSWPHLEVQGGPVQAVRGFAPSVVKAGEPFEVSVRSEDMYWNRASGSIPAYEVELNGKAFASIPASNEGIHLLRDVTIEEPGVYRFGFRSTDGKVEGSSNPVWVQEEPQYRVFWGETHGHTGFAEGQGSAESFFRFGLEDSRLDFLTLSEHDIWLDDSEWRTLQNLVRKYQQPGRFIPFLGFEWTMSRSRGGHHNVLFRTPDRDRVGAQEANLLPQLYNGLHAANDAEDVLIIPHAHQAGDWTQNDPELEKLVEIYSMHGSFEWFGNMYLKYGHEVGFVGASDTHQAKPGYNYGMYDASRLGQPSGLAAVLAPEKTTDAIFDALRDLGAYATSGQRIILDAQLNKARMGTRQPNTKERKLHCRVIGTSPIDQIEVVKNGTVIYGQDYLSAPLTSHLWLMVIFDSSSAVLGEERDNPRAGRPWDGHLEIRNARIRSLSIPGFDNLHFEYARLDPERENVVRFYVETRGRQDRMLLELEGASPSTELLFQLEPVTERKFSPALVRPLAKIPGTLARMKLDGLRHGRLTHPMPVDEHEDAIRLQTIDPHRPLEQTFDFTDLGSAQEGDYYYVRVTQLDGGRAWSSPFWVGERKREQGSGK